MSHLQFYAAVIGSLLATLHPNTPAAAPPAKHSAADVSAFIDKLTELADSDIGYSPSVSGSIFLPLDREGQESVMLLFQNPTVSSDTMRDIVKRGAAAVPDLLNHLDDRRPTKIIIAHDSLIGGMWFMASCDTNSRTAPRAPANGADEREISAPFVGADEHRHVLTVGDLCFVALGQIVNRNFFAVRYQPTAIVIVSSVTRSAALRAEVRRRWQGLTPAKHRASLIADFREPDTVERLIGACKRLSYYYPDTLEPLALELLKRPTYDVLDVFDFVRNRLYAAADAKERRKLFDAYLDEHGIATRDGILLLLFQDLDDQEADEQKRRRPPLNNRGFRPREILVELYGLPKTVNSEHKPVIDALSSTEHARIVAEGLIFDDSEKIDRAFRDYLVGDPQSDLAKACLKRLIGRGYDADIERFCQRPMKGIPEHEKTEYTQALDKLGWTPVHVAVERGDSDLLRSRLARGLRPDAADRRGRTPLHLAAAAGNRELVRLLLEAKAPVDPKDADGQTPAQRASEQDHSHVVRLLAEHGCAAADAHLAASIGNIDRLVELLRSDPSALERGKNSARTPLYLAAREGSLKAVEVLLRAGADANRADREGWTPLHAATVRGHEEIVRLLLRGKADVRCRIGANGPDALLLAAAEGKAKVAELLLAHKADPESEESEHHRRPLHLAVAAGSIPTVSVLLAGGAKVDALDKGGNSPLHNAVEAGRPDLVRLLLDHGADAGRAVSQKHLRPLHLAAQQGSREVVELLLNRGADVNARSSEGNTTPLHDAARAGHAGAALALLEHGADLNALEDVAPSLDREELLDGMGFGADFLLIGLIQEHMPGLIEPGKGMTPLHTACRYGRTDVARVLLDNKSDPNTAVTSTGATALHLAAANGHEDVVALLLRRGANIDAANRGGDTPLHLALERERRAIVDLLLSGKANPNARDKDGAAPLHFAASTGDPKLVQRLLDKGADINARTKERGITAFHNAAGARRQGAAKLLLQRGAAIHVTTSAGETPLHFAARAGRPETVDLLLLLKADPNARDRSGKTPLHAAAAAFALDAAKVERLLAAGSDRSLKDNEGKRPVDLVEPGDEQAAGVIAILKEPATGKRKPH
jgi:ankyrin repeat protein